MCKTAMREMHGRIENEQIWYLCIKINIFINEILSNQYISMQLLQRGNAELCDVIPNQPCYILDNTKGEQNA